MRFENLKEGSWYAIFDIAQEPPTENQFGWCSTPTKTIYNGLPHKLIAVSFPFAFCRCVNGTTSTFDTRVVTLTSVTDKFARAWHRDWREHQIKKGDAPPRKRKKQKDPEWHCPRCGGRIVEKMTHVSDGWRYACRECGYDRGAVTK